MSVKRVTLQPAITLTAAALTAASGTIHGTMKSIGNEIPKRLVAYLNVTSHDNTAGNETYQFYITTGMKTASGQYLYWDVGAFVVVSGADAIVGQLIFSNCDASEPTTTIADGTVTKIAPTHALGTDWDTRGSITTATTRHGLMGSLIGYTITGGGTTPGPITFEVGAELYS